MIAKQTLLLFLGYFLFASPVFGTTNSIDTITHIREVNVTASIGENLATIFGYTGSSQKVELEGTNVYSQTYSNSTGYFEFNQIVLPKNPPDLCLSSTDNLNRKTYPVCIAPPPGKNYFTSIGPILLAPTLSLNTNLATPGSQVIATGVGIPNSQVQISLFQQESTPILFPKTVYAQDFSLPTITVPTDSEGNFSLNLPTTYSNSFQIFSKNIYLDSPSSKSTTLSYYLPSYLLTYLLLSLRLFLILCLILLVPVLFFLNKTSKNRYLPKLYDTKLACVN